VLEEIPQAIQEALCVGRDRIFPRHLHPAHYRSPRTVSKYPDCGFPRGFPQPRKANAGVIALATKSMRERLGE
jgi:hypothetical protein